MVKNLLFVPIYTILYKYFDSIVLYSPFCPMVDGHRPPTIFIKGQLLRLLIRYISRFFYMLSASKPISSTLATDQKWPLKSSLYLLPKCSRVPLTIVLISGISTMVNDTVLNFGKRCEDDLWVIFDQWPKLHLGFDAEPEIWILKVIYFVLI